MTKQEQFFYNQAGYSYDPKTETQEQGRVRVAKALAAAETHARDSGWSIDWELERENPRDVLGAPCPRKRCNDPKCPHVHYDPSNDFVCAVLRGENGKVLGSLGMIEESPEHKAKMAYRRVVEAELALEAMPDMILA